MRLLLDSHTILWVTLADDRLPGPVRDAIEDRSNLVAVSVATMWELTMKAMAGRLHLPEAPETYLDGLIRDFGYELIPVHQRHVAALPGLPPTHADPFDRMLIAQALVEDLDLVTGDEQIRRYPVRTIW